MPKKIVPLTDTKCRTARYSADGGNKLFDGGGLVLELMPSGAKKWRYRYRGPSGKETTITIGDYPATGLAEARQQHAAMRKMVASGKDPVIERESARQAAMVAAGNTVRVVVDEWIDTRKANWSTKHLSRVSGVFGNDVYPTLGSRPMDGVSNLEVLAVLRRIEQRGAHEMAYKALEYIGSAWRYAVGTSRASADVTVGLRELLKPKPPVQHHPHVDEESLPSLLARVETYSGRPETVLAVKLMVLTFLRTNELRWAEWTEFDFEAAEWRVPAARMKGSVRAKASGEPHVVPLARQTIELLEKLRGYTGRYRFLFPGERNPAHQAMSVATINKALKSLGFEGQQTGHGFRGLASTILNERSGFQPDAIERQLAHVEQNKIRKAYNHATYMDERRRMMQWWADFIDQKSGKNVVPMVREA